MYSSHEQEDVQQKALFYLNSSYSTEFELSLSEELSLVGDVECSADDDSDEFGSASEGDIFMDIPSEM